MFFSIFSKPFLLFFAVLIVAISAIDRKDPEQQKKYEQMVEECKNEIGISDLLASKLKKGDFSDRSQKAQCFTLCIFKKKDFYDEKGTKFDRDIMIKELLYRETDPSSAVEEVTRILNKCVGKIGANQCETAFLVYECYITKRFGLQEHREIDRACAREFHVPVELALKLKTGNFTERGKGAQCLTSCILKRKNYFKDGKWNKDNLMKEIFKELDERHKDKMTKSVDKCLSIVGAAGDCETAYKSYECFWNVRFGPERTQEYVKTCSNENNITFELARNFENGNFSNCGKEIQSFAKCLFKKQGYFGKDGKLDRDLIIGRLIQKEPEAPKIIEITKAVDKCIGIFSENESETAFKFYECYWINRFRVLTPNLQSKTGKALLKTAVSA